jgi:hypothetical protein
LLFPQFQIVRLEAALTIVASADIGKLIRRSGGARVAAGE